MSLTNGRAPVTLASLQACKASNSKFACVTAYDSAFAELANNAGVDVILVGDSLGMVVQGGDSTLQVTMKDMLYHTSIVCRSSSGALVMGDMPFMSYYSEGRTLENAARLVRSGAKIVKLEGGAWIAESTRLLVERGIPVCAHMGLTPQSIHRFGGFRVQGRDPVQADMILNEAVMLEQAGASVLLLEAVPACLAAKVTKTVSVPVIGIGAGCDVDGQIMVMHDLLGITPSSLKTPKFVKNFLAESTDGIRGAFKAYVDAVKTGRFPGLEHSYS